MLLRERPSLEELFHQAFVGFGDHLDERLAGRGRVCSHVGGNVRLRALTTAVGQENIRFLRDEIDDAAKRFLFADWQLNRHHCAIERGVDRLERPLDARPLAIEAIDDDEPGQPGLFGRLPCLLGLHLHARHRVDNHDRGVGDAQRGARIRQKVSDAWRVDEVDFGLVPLGVGEAGGERVLACDFFVVVIGNRGAVVDLSKPVHGAGIEQCGRSELRFT